MKNYSEDKKHFDWSSYIKENSDMDPNSLFIDGIQYPKMIINNIVDNINSEDIQSIMELGCSSGVYCCLLENAFNKKLYKIGIDSDKSILDFKLLDKYFCENVFLFQHKDKADLVFSLGLIEHFSQKDRERLFLKHLELSSKFVAIGFPNTDISLRYFFIKIFDDFFGRNKHYSIKRKEIINLVKKNNANIIFEGYIGNNSFLQKMLKIKKQLNNSFLKDYYLILLEKEI
ncbi:class I SAM-dependent methyltransferase [bacterium]|nr:class I SAM-dependent methyltransferase [bacterium]